MKKTNGYGGGGREKNFQGDKSSKCQRTKGTVAGEEIIEKETGGQIC